MAEDLGIERGTLRRWLERYGTGRKRLLTGRWPAALADPAAAVGEVLDDTPEQRAARLAARVAELEADNAKLTTERDSPVGGQAFRRGDELVSSFQFVSDHQPAYEVKRLCELVQVERSSLYPWKAAARAREARAAADAEPASGSARSTSRTRRWAPRITAELNDGAGEAERVNHERVAGVVREE
ncbi:hypothetical protein [Terrabacter sp. 2YAF2]|uniref:hypothetical protein n=1 Tax=Terrabacter sp. 2YAF2 TaxID=3233026 RepID=UPI003F988374